MKTPAQKKPIIEVLSGKRQATPPMWLMRQAGRYLPEYREVRKKAGSFLDLCYTPKLAAEVTLQPIRRFDFDAAIIFSDILVIPHAMGMKLEYQEKKGPVLDALKTKTDIQKLKQTGVAKKLEPVMEALSLVKKSLPKHTALIGFAGAPWTVATYMVEGGTSKHFDKVKKMAAGDPANFTRLIKKITEATTEYLIAQGKAGAEVLQIFDSWAGVLDEDGFNEWVIEPTREIIKNVRKALPHIPIIGFPKGAGLYYEKYLKQVAPQGLGLDYTVPAGWAAKTLQPHIAVQGNLDPTILLSDKNTIRERVKHLKNTLGNKPYIFNLGHGILPETPIENVECLVKAIRGT